MTDQKPIEERIAERTDLTIAGATEVSSTVGGLAFKDMGQVLEFSKLMSVSRQAVPKHLRGEPGACMAVSLQALNWRMDPFAVANKSYAVNDRIAYEAQLIQAVIEQRAPIKGRIKGAFEGAVEKRVCVLKVISAEDGEEIEYRSPEIGMIKVKNSPLWKTDPDQQLWYYSARAMCRRHFPDVLLGVYSKDEIESAEGIRDITPKPGKFAQMAQDARSVEEPTEDVKDETATQEVQADEKEDVVPDAEDAEFVPDDDQANPPEGEATFNPDPFTNAYTDGQQAFQAGDNPDVCELEGDDRKNWIAGFNFEASKGEG